MITDFNFQLKNVGIINDAEINLGRINIVAGDNSTGKSTSSKILYSFLRSNSKSRKEIIKNDLNNQIFDLAMDLFSYDLDEESIGELKEFINSDFAETDVVDSFNSIKKIYLKNSIKTNDLANVSKLIDIYLNNGSQLSNTILNYIIGREFGKTLSKSSEVSFSGLFNNNPFEYKGHLKNSGIENNGKLIVENIFYLDSFSFFDLLSNGGLQNTEHVEHIINSIKDDESNLWADEINNENIIELEDKIFDIIGGNFILNDNNIIFNDSGQEFLMKNTASGVKQIGIIQMLLNTRKLRENSFLIIDEIEVNLHPKWIIKLAEIITLLASELNITVYINTHSPLFIEAIRTYSEKLDLLDETNFYLTYPSKEVKNKFDIKYVPTEDLNIIFYSLGEPYEILSKISINNQFR